MIKPNNFSIELDEPEFAKIENSYNANTEIRVRLGDDFCLGIIIATPDNLKYLMEKDKLNFHEPECPWIIIRKMTKEIIYEAVQGYMEASPGDGFWLKMCYFAGDFDNSVFDDVQAQEIEMAKRTEEIYKEHIKMSKQDPNIE